jgi:aminopeptidase YwaD
VLEVRDFLSGEFEPLPLADLMEYLRAREKAGAVKLTPKPAEPKAKGAKQ